jgi:hypothetical protein
MTASNNGQPITDKTRVSLSLRDWAGLVAVIVCAVLWVESRDRGQDARIREVEMQIVPLKGEVLPDLKRDIRDLSQSTAALRDAVTRLQAQNERR